MPDEEHPADTPPSLEALIAGTVALMTIWADPCPHCPLDAATQRSVLAHKVVSNLHILRGHAGLGAGLRQVMDKAHRRWAGLATPLDAQDAPADRGLVSATALH